MICCDILALDLGTKTGFAHMTAEEPIQAGTWVLANSAEVTAWGKARLTRRCDPRVARLFARLKLFQPRVVVFEDVQFASYTLQVQLWSSLRAAVWLAFHSGAIHMDCVPVGTLKAFATGHGGATKQMMNAALKDFPKAGFDDNAIDAIHLCRWAKHNLIRMIK